MSATSQRATQQSFETWKALLCEIVPAHGCWSEEQYLVLTDHLRRFVEFTDGYLEVLPFPTEAHQLRLKSLLLAFSSFFDSRGGEVLFGPLRLQLGPGKYRIPDLLLLLSADDPRSQSRYRLGADLVLEVVNEDASQRDLVDKPRDYAEGKIQEYWIVNSQTETITVLQLVGDAYTEAGCYRRGEAAQSVLRPEFTVAVSPVFDAAKAH